MKVLVTGGGGFIGSHITDHLIKDDHDVVVLDDLSGGSKENVNPKAEFVKGSILNHELLSHLFDKHKFDYVFHAAAYAAEGLSHFIKRFNFMNNLVGSVNLINESVKHDIKCFVFTSSIAVYGKGQLPMHEDTTPLPEDSYGIAKLAVEQELKASKEMFDLNYVIFRPHNVYGERQNLGDKYRNVLGIFMNLLMQDKPMTIFGDGLQTRAFTYIDDVAPLIASCINNEKCWNQVFNIGADKVYSVKELALTTAKAMGKEPKLNHVDARNEVVHAYSDHKKVKEYFGDQNETSLHDGVTKMALWAKSAGTKSVPLFQNIEIEKNLPPSWVKGKEEEKSPKTQ